MGSDHKALSGVDRTSIALNALSISLIVITVFIGGLAVVGWDKLEKIIRRDVEESIKDDIISLETLFEGRVISMLGFAIGELSTAPDEMDATNPGRLSEAVEHCQRGYELLEKTGLRRPMLMGLNNLVYYSSIYGDKAKGRYLLQKALILRDAGYELNRPRLLLTYCRALLRYGTTLQQREEVQSIASELLHGTLTDQEKTEAKFYLQHLASLSPIVPDAAK